MATALLVSEQRFKQWTNVDENVRVEEITPFIIQAQDIYIQDTLGTSFYNRVKAGIIANDLNDDEKELLNDYIGPCLMQYALYLILPGIKYKLVDKGLVSGASEDTSTTSLDELKFLRTSVLDTAEFYSKRLREFLVENPGLFSQYDAPGSKGMLPNRTNPYTSGLVIPRPYGSGLKSMCDCYDGCENCGYTNVN